MTRRPAEPIPKLQSIKQELRSDQVAAGFGFFVTFLGLVGLGCSTSGAR
jgi:hypothetical protein